jgi:hypothetical protein
MRTVALAGAALALLVATAVADAQPGVSAPSVEIAWPAPSRATNADALAVDVRFEAGTDAQGQAAAVRTIVLTLDERTVGVYSNPPQVKQGTHRFTVDLAAATEGAQTLRAFAYERKQQAGRRGESSPLELIVDRTPPELELTAPQADIFVREPRVTLAGTASDALSGLASLVCAGREVTAAASFGCEAELVAGANVLTVRAVDRAGNETTRRVGVERFDGGLAARPRHRRSQPSRTCSRAARTSGRTSRAAQRS